MNRPLILPHTENLDVGVNELLQRHSFNRNSVKLLENDSALQDAHIRCLEEMNVLEYNRNRQYMQNELVWVKRSLGDFKLFLVRCTVNQREYPGEIKDLQQIVDDAYDPSAEEQPEPEFDRNGWKDENAYLKIDDYGIREKLRRFFTMRFAAHERDGTYHRFGTLPADEKEINKKIMLADLSNADSGRNMMFYPHYTRKINPDDSVLYGFYRVWDSGTLEVDLIYRLGWRERISMDGYGADVIWCNDFSAKGSNYAGSDATKYFNTNKDRDIFAPLSCGWSEIDDMVQVNRNDYVNTYSAEIKFPRFEFKGRYIQFLDGQYMIFGSDMMSQDADKLSAQIEPGANCMTYFNKTKQGFTAVYVTYPDSPFKHVDGYNAEQGGLVSNSFHCHIVGRWIEEPIQV